MRYNTICIVIIEQTKDMIDFAALSDLQLQQMSANGDRAAEEALVGRYLQLVRACSRPFFLAGGESEDLIPKRMIVLFCAIRQYDLPPRAVFRTLL